MVYTKEQVNEAVNEAVALVLADGEARAEVYMASDEVRAMVRTMMKKLPEEHREPDVLMAFCAGLCAAIEVGLVLATKGKVQ